MVAMGAWPVIGSVPVAESWDDFAARLTVAPDWPVAIRGGLPKTWSWEEVRRVGGDRVLEVDVAADGRHTGGLGPYDPALRRRVKMSLAELLDRLEGKGAFAPLLRAGESCYGYQVDSGNFPELERLLPRPPHLPENPKALLWISGPPGLTPPHSDGWVTNCFVQLAGRKRVWLWPPDQAKALGLRPYGEQHSRQMLFDPATGEIPFSLEGTGALEIDLEGGDAVWFPEGWIHALRTETLSASVAFWGSQRTQLENALIQVVLELRSLPAPLQQLYLHLFRWPAGVLNEGQA